MLRTDADPAAHVSAAERAICAGAAPGVYRSPDEDSSRWNTFDAVKVTFIAPAEARHTSRSDDQRSAVQQEAELPAPLSEISPWPHWRGEPEAAVLDRLAQQRHRRADKTHTPIDGLPLDAKTETPWSLRHPLAPPCRSIGNRRTSTENECGRLTGQPEGRAVERPLPDWLSDWVEDDADPRTSLDSLAGVCITSWTSDRRNANVALVHYYDLSVDLNRTMRELASYLEVDTPQRIWSEMVHAASFDQMQADADRLAPDTQGILKSRAAFFRRAALGEGWALLDPAHQRRYIERVTALGSSDLTRWMNRPAASVTDNCRSARTGSGTIRHGDERSVLRRDPSTARQPSEADVAERLRRHVAIGGAYVRNGASIRRRE